MSVLAPPAAPVPLGAWEKALADEHLRDGAHGSAWLVELEAPLDPALVHDALQALRPAFPVHFSRVRPRAGGGIEAVPGADVLLHRERAEGGGRAYLGVMANARLHPVEDGLFRCHLVDGPVPLLGFQATHVAGDGYTNHRFRQAFAAALDALSRGRRPEVRPPPAAYAVGLDEIHARLPMDPRALHDVVRRAARLRTPRMSLRARDPAGLAEGEADGGGPCYALRVFRAVMEPEAFAPLVARAERLGVAPLALLGAAATGAARRAFDPWDERPGDFIAVGVPRDMRVALGRAGAAGNLVYGQGIPVFGDDPAETDALAAVFHDRLTRGRANRVMYRHFGQRLAAAAAAPLAAPPDAGRIACRDGRWVLDPLPQLGVTELPTWGDVEALAGIPVRDTFFQQPVLTRRFAGGRVHLAATVRWHPRFDARIRAFFAAFVAALLPGRDVAWELL